jgi:hypothetical protein
MTFDKTGIFNKLRKIRPLADVRAVAPGRAVPGEERQAASTIAAETGVDADDATAFENAGWTFVKGAQPETADADHRVVVDGDGHLKILSNALNVKFDPSLPRAIIEEILNRHGLSIRRDMGFSPNLFLVTGTEGDVMSKIQSLNELKNVEYAEPVLIEPIKSR